MPKASNYWSKNRRAGGNNQAAGGNQPNGEKGGAREQGTPHGPAHHREAGGGGTQHAGGNNNNNNHNNNNTNHQATAANKRAISCVKSRSELRRILHDKLEWNEKTAALNLTLLVCADEADPAEAELIIVSSGCVATTTRYVRSDLVEAQRRKEKEERARDMMFPDDVISEVELEEPPQSVVDEKKAQRNCEGDCSIPKPPPSPLGDELFRFDPSSKTHKCKVLNQIARSVQKAWCGLLFVPAYQLGQATSFIKALNPKPDSSHYVDGYVSRLCCLEDLLWALRSARGLLNVEPPLAYSIWHSMREEDMAQLSEYSELTCACVIATLHERAQSPPSLLDGSELWPSVVVPPRNCAPPRLPWISHHETTGLDDIFNDEY